MRISIALAIACLVFICCAPCHAVGLPPGTSLQIVANADYINELNEPQSSNPASVTLTVIQSVGVSIEWTPATGTVTHGTDVYVPATVTNMGNGTDTFGLTVSSTHGWPVTIIRDSNADGIHQAGEQMVLNNTTAMVSGGYCACFVRVSVPNNAVTGDTISFTAASTVDPAEGTEAVNVEVASPGLAATRITLGTSPETPYREQTVSIDGVLEPAMQRTIELTITPPTGPDVTDSVTSGADGSFHSEFSPPAAGQYTIAAVFVAAAQYAGSTDTETIDVVEKSVTSIALEASPSAPSAGDTVAISGTITPAIAANITLTIAKPSGPLSEIECVADQFGHFSANTLMDVSGSWTLSADYAGSPSTQACSDSLSIAVSAGQAAHAVSIQAGPLASPTIVTAPEATQCSITAVDSYGHNLGYSWTDGGAGGSFAPNSSNPNPSYLPAENNTESNRTVILTCTANCTVDSDVVAVGSVNLVVRPSTLVAPSVNSVAPANGTELVEVYSDIIMMFSEPMNTTAVQQAFTITPAVGGSSYTWNGDNTVLTFAHQALSPSTTYTCTISTGAKDAGGTAVTAPVQWTFHTVSGLRFDPGDSGAALGVLFPTPRIVMSDSSALNSVFFRIGVPASISVDTALDGNGSLACVIKGADTSSVASSWDAQTREIVVNAQIENQGHSTEIIKSIRLTAPGTTGNVSLTIQQVPSLVIHVRNANPGDFNRDGVINIVDAARFVMEWVRWHQETPPAFDADIDEIYDLAPHTDAVWPAWTAIGDQLIDEDDSEAFNECWVAAHSEGSSQTVGSYAPVRQTGFRTNAISNGQMCVTVDKANAGMFEAVVKLPSAAKFTASLMPSGNLAGVEPGPGAGKLFFSEYDAKTRSVRIIGSVLGKAPYNVANICFSR